MDAGTLEVLVVAEQLRRRAPGGIGTYTTGLLEGLVGEREAGRLSDLDVEIFASPSRESVDPLARFGFRQRSSRLPAPALVRAWDRGLRKAPSGPGLVHNVSLSGPNAAAPLVTTIYDLAWRHVPETFPRRGRHWHEAALARAFARRAYLVVPSEATREDLLAAGADPARLTVIPGGADHLPPADEAATDELLERLGVIDGFLLSVGTIEPRKNLERLVAAYAVARPSLSAPWPLVLVGPTGWGAAGAVPAPGVVTAGHVDAPVLAGLYARARLVAYVPLFEGFGLPVLEAMHAGAPVVATAVPSAGGATETVEARSVESIAAGLVAVANDDGRRDELVGAGRAHVAAFRWSTTARAHAELWRAIGAR